jgi:hypothetical protein
LTAPQRLNESESRAPFRDADHDRDHEKPFLLMTPMANARMLRKLGVAIVLLAHASGCTLRRSFVEAGVPREQIARLRNGSSSVRLFMLDGHFGEGADGYGPSGYQLHFEMEIGPGHHLLIAGCRDPTLSCDGRRYDLEFDAAAGRVYRLELVAAAGGGWHPVVVPDE